MFSLPFPESREKVTGKQLMEQGAGQTARWKHSVLQRYTWRLAADAEWAAAGLGDEIKCSWGQIPSPRALRWGPQRQGEEEGKESLSDTGESENVSFSLNSFDRSRYWLLINQNHSIHFKWKTESLLISRDCADSFRGTKNCVYVLRFHTARTHKG